MTGSGAAGWSLGASDARLLEGHLDAFLHQSNARCAMLVDRAGALVLAAGDWRDLDATAFASLAAADFSANHQLASLLGEPDVASLLHQGERESILLADVAGCLILAAVFDERTTLGLVRIKGRALAVELAPHVRELVARASARPRGMELASGWAAEAEGEIDRLFGAL